MTIELINRKSPEDRRSVPLDPASLPTILQGQVLQEDANGYAVLADGAGDIPDPMWAFTKTGRLDTDAGESVTVVEAPFEAYVDTDGYVGTPAAGDALIVGTTTEVGKLKVQAVSTVAHVMAVVARCVQAPDANGRLKIKAIR